MPRKKFTHAASTIPANSRVNHDRISALRNLLQGVAKRQKLSAAPFFRGNVESRLVLSTDKEHTCHLSY